MYIVTQTNRTIKGMLVLLLKNRKKDGKTDWVTSIMNIFFNAILKHGWEEFTHEILFTDLSKDDAEQIEKRLIKK